VIISPHYRRESHHKKGDFKLAVRDLAKMLLKDW